jgi:Tfp pilus assembly protein FimT
MNVRELSHSRARSRGITLVEILLVIGLLVILAGFAVPSFGTASARAEMKAALENLEYSIGTARNVARLTDSSVSLNIVQAPGATHQKITFAQSGQSQGKHGPDIPDYLLPEGIELRSEQQLFVFDARGLVIQPGTIVLVARDDDSVTSTLEIN